MADHNWNTQPKDVLRAGPVMPVMVIHDLADAVPLAQALVAGGIRVLEITLRTPVALDAIAAIRGNVQGAIVGAGTIANPRQLADAAAAGAEFAISPGITEALLRAANQGAVALIPGVATLSELMLGMDHGLDHFKFFPAAAAGGIPMLKAIAGPFPKAVFCPTGGISVDNYLDYLALANVACVGGSWLAPAEAIRAKDWPAITALAAQAVGAAA